MYDYLSAHIMCVCAHVYIGCPQRPEEGIRCPRPGDTDDCDPPRSSVRVVSTDGHWAISPGPKLTFLARLPDQQALQVCLAKIPSTVLAGTHSMPSFLHGCWGSNSGPRLSRASVLTYGSIPSPMYWFLTLLSHERKDPGVHTEVSYIPESRNM